MLENEYVPTEVHWSQVPGRDAAWKEQTIKNTSEQQFKVELSVSSCSVDTLISPSKRGLCHIQIQSNKTKVLQFTKKQNQSTIILSLDFSKRNIYDYSAFVVVDSTTCLQSRGTYRNNEIKPIIFLLRRCKNYNNAYKVSLKLMILEDR